MSKLMLLDFPTCPSDASVFASRPMPHRCKVERRIVWGLLAWLAQAGWLPVAVDDGGDEEVKTTTAAEAFGAVFAVDESWLFFQKGDGRAQGIMLVGGNGEDIISDWHSGNEDFNAAVEGFCKALEEAVY